MSQVRIQDAFAALHVAQVQNEDWIHKLVDHEALTVIVPTKCEPLSLDNSSKEEDFSAVLDAWGEYIAYEIERERNAQAGDRGSTSTTSSEDVLEPVRRINKSGPPERFRRRSPMLRTTTIRAMEHASQPVTHP